MTPSRRSLWPREHGAYGQLGVPLVAALASGRPGVAALGVGAAVIAGFLAHEPALVLAGHRGPRARADHGGRARRRLIGLGVIAAAGAGLGMIFGGAAVTAALLAAVALAAVTALLAAARQEKSLVGECVAAGALAAAAVPVAIASGVAPTGALEAWLAWALGFAAVTGAVRDVIARGKRRRRPWAPGVLAVASATIVAVGGWVAGPVMAGLPLAAVAVALGVAPAAPRRLRQTGWALVAASLATGLWIVVRTRG